jgi:hypothetical protein
MEQNSIIQGTKHLLVGKKFETNFKCTWRKSRIKGEPGRHKVYIFEDQKSQIPARTNFKSGINNTKSWNK